MNDYIKNPLIKSLAEQEFTFFADETLDVTSIEQLAVYATFENQGIIKEHFIGVIPMSKLVGSTLSAENIFRILQTFFENIKVPLRLARFVYMGNTNVNYGIKGGLRAYLEDSFLMLRWIGCTNHKLALCFKHVLPNYQNVSNVDIFLRNLWKYFKYRTLAINLLQECSEIYGNISSVVHVYPSTTCWTAHDRACMVVFKNFQAVLQALSTCYNERKEAEALGLFIQAVSLCNISTILMLLEVFSAITPLTLCLQKSQDKICLVDIPNHLETSSLKLNYVRTVKETRKFLTEQNFRELVQIAEEQTSLPTASHLRAEKFDFTEFSEEFFPPIFFLFTPCKAEQPLRGMELQIYWRFTGDLLEIFKQS